MQLSRFVTATKTCPSYHNDLLFQLYFTNITLSNALLIVYASYI